METKFKDIVHNQDQWEIIEKKLEERNKFEKAKSILCKTTHYLVVNRSHDWGIPAPIDTIYETLSTDEETIKLVQALNKVEEVQDENYKLVHRIAELEKKIDYYKSKRIFGIRINHD